MEELKVLIDAIAGLPDLAIWVIAMYFFFKIAIVGSVFGIIRLGIMKLWDYFKTKKESKEVVVEVSRDSYNVYDVTFDRHVIKGVEESLYKVIKDMVMYIRQDDRYSYIHGGDVQQLRDFFEEYKKKYPKKENGEGS